MKTSYKLWYVIRDDFGNINECAVRFYEGNNKDVEQLNPTTKQVETVNKYVEEKQLSKAELPYLSNQRVKRDMLGTDNIVFTKDDLGGMKTERQLKDFLNTKLQEDSKRTPVLD